LHRKIRKQLISLVSLIYLLLLLSMAAQVIVSKTFLLVLVIAAFAVASAQDSESMAPAPTPGMDAGAAGFSSPVSGAIVGLSLIVSLLGFLKH
jgi:hypothetical protein